MLDEDVLARTTVEVHIRKQGSAYITIPKPIRRKWAMMDGSLMEIAILRIKSPAQEEATEE